MILEHMAIRCRIVQPIYAKIFISNFLVLRWHSQDVHSHTAILRMRILTLPFSGCAFSRCHSQDAHSHAAILTIRIRTI